LYIVNSHNEMTLLPFGKGSKILIDNKFVEDYDTIDVGIFDINPKHEEPAPKILIPSVNEMNNPCEVEV